MTIWVDDAGAEIAACSSLQFLRVVLNILPMFVHRQRFGATRNIFELDRHEIPNIDADVDAVARTPPIVVDMTENLKRIPPGMVPGDHRVMAQRVRLVFGAVPNLGKMGDAVPWQIQRWLEIVVAHDQMFTRTWELTEQHF